MSFDPRPIGMFDSGVGGLSVLKELRRLVPNEDILYFADQGHVPYGPRPLEEIQSYVRGITRFFLSHHVKLIVIPCNAASAAGLKYIRGLYPDVPFVGMEPAIKPAAAQTRNGVIGVITTKATFQGELFASVMERFAKDKNVVTQVCPDFVLLVEAGKVEGPEARQTAEHYLQPLLDQGIDQLVIGCTHFPFLMSTLQSVLGPDINIIDPGPAIARQSDRMLDNLRNDPEHQGTISFFTSGDKSRFTATANLLLGINVNDQVTAVAWDEKNVSIRDSNPG